MALSIKNEETHRIVRELADRRGISLVAAVTEAARETLERDKARDDENQKQGFAAWLMEIGRETAPLLNDGRTSKEVMDALYDDETGLPK